MKIFHAVIDYCGEPMFLDQNSTLISYMLFVLGDS